MSSTVSHIPSLSPARDGNGTLSALELGRGLQSLLKTKLSRGELGDLMASINKSETDQISYPEFVVAVCGTRAGSAVRAAAASGGAALPQGRRRSADQLLDALSDKARTSPLRRLLSLILLLVIIIIICCCRNCRRCRCNVVLTRRNDS